MHCLLGCSWRSTMSGQERPNFDVLKVQRITHRGTPERLCNGVRLHATDGDYNATIWSATLVNCCSVRTPSVCPTTWPWWMNTSFGMEETRYRIANSGSWSTLILTTFTLPSYAVATLSSTGPSILHGAAPVRVEIDNNWGRRRDDFVLKIKTRHCFGCRHLQSPCGQEMGYNTLSDPHPQRKLRRMKRLSFLWHAVAPDRGEGGSLTLR